MSVLIISFHAVKKKWNLDLWNVCNKVTRYQRTMSLLHARVVVKSIDFLYLKLHENYEGHIKQVWNWLLSVWSEVFVRHFLKLSASAVSSSKWLAVKAKREMQKTKKKLTNNLSGTQKLSLRVILINSKPLFLQNKISKRKQTLGITCKKKFIYVG